MICKVLMGRQGDRARLLHLRGTPQGDVAAGARRVGRFATARIEDKSKHCISKAAGHLDCLVRSREL